MPAEMSRRKSVGGNEHENTAPNKKKNYRENRYGVRQQTSNTYRILPLPSYYEHGEPRYADDHALPV